MSVPKRLPAAAAILVMLGGVMGVMGATGMADFPPILAPENDQDDLHDTTELTGDNYVYYRFQADAPGEISFEEAHAFRGGSHYSVNLWAWKDGDPVDSIFAGSSSLGGKENLHAFVGGPVNKGVRIQGNVFCEVLYPTLGGAVPPIPPDCIQNAWGGFDISEAGHWNMVLVTVQDGPWNSTLQVTADTTAITVLKKEIGFADFLHDPDFRGDLNVGRFHGSIGALAVKAMLDTAVERSIQHGLFGLFKGFTNLQTLEMGYDRLATDEHFDGERSYLFHNEPASDYRFRVDQHIDASSYLMSTPYVFLVIADVDLPPEALDEAAP